MLYRRLRGSSTKLEIGSAVEMVENIATHQAVGRVQLLFMAPGKTRQMPFGLWVGQLLDLNTQALKPSLW